MIDLDKDIHSIVEEYKMSMGGSFFNNMSKEDSNLKLEKAVIENGLENHLFDMQELLSIYDKLSEYSKRAFFQKVVLKLIKSHDKNK